MKILLFLSPILRLIPNIEQPKRKVPFKDKIYWTIVVLLIYLVYSQIPLYGIHLGATDPLYWIRVIMASNRGTLMELGITPLMTSSLLMQLLISAGVVTVDQSNPYERELLEQAQKLMGIGITVFQSFAYIFGGMYGNPKELGIIKIALIVLQLLISGLVLMLLDDLLQNGWGVGSGSNLFIATNYCEAVFWKCFSPATFGVGRNKNFEGAIISLMHLFSIRRSKVRALKEALFRKGLPNITNLLATVVIFLVVVFLQGFKIEIPIQSIQYRNYNTSYPIKLFYTSSMPVILQNAVVSNIFFVSQLLYKHFPDNIVVKILGVWDATDRRGMPTDGLAYYISPPENLFEKPFHVLFYCLFTLISCGFFSRMWIEMSGSSPKEIANKLLEQGMTIKGYRKESFVKVLYRYIPVAAWAGGVVIGVLTIVADMLGAVGSGTGILLAVNTIFQYYESYVKESLREGGNTLIGI